MTLDDTCYSRLEAAPQHPLLPSGIDKLTHSKVIDISLGRYRKRPSRAIAIPTDLRVDTAERKEFYLLLVGMGLRQMSSYWARRLVF